jgi:hypothetical protein
MQLLSSSLSLSLSPLVGGEPRGRIIYVYHQGGEKSCGESRLARPQVGPGQSR